MSGDMPPLPLYAYMAWTGTTYLLFSWRTIYQVTIKEIDTFNVVLKRNY